LLWNHSLEIKLPGTSFGDIGGFPAGLGFSTGFVLQQPMLAKKLCVIVPTICTGILKKKNKKTGKYTKHIPKWKIERRNSKGRSGHTF
jgi:hypothetical protein